MLKEPDNMPIPIESDFYFDGMEDEKWALQHYLGKNISFAEKRYYSLDPLSMVHDFTHVGAKAFIYYIFGAFRYLQSEQSKNEPDVYAALPDILQDKLIEDPLAIKPIANYLIVFSGWAITNYEKFGVNRYFNIYGDVKLRYLSLQEKLEALV